MLLLNQRDQALLNTCAILVNGTWEAYFSEAVSKRERNHLESALGYPIRNFRMGSTLIRKRVSLDAIPILESNMVLPFALKVWRLPSNLWSKYFYLLAKENASSLQSVQLQEILGFPWTEEFLLTTEEANRLQVESRRLWASFDHFVGNKVAFSLELQAAMQSLFQLEQIQTVDFPESLLGSMASFWRSHI